MANRVFTDSRYTFTSPSRNRKYIQYLREIEAFNMKGIQPTRKEVQVSLGDPDPTVPCDFVREQAIKHQQFVAETITPNVLCHCIESIADQW